jgi:hypothetical protein
LDEEHAYLYGQGAANDSDDHANKEENLEFAAI